MKKEEVSCLVNKHMNNGLDHHHAVEKVIGVSNYNKLIKRYEKSIKYLTKRLERMEKENTKLKIKLRNTKQKKSKVPIIKTSQDNESKEIFMDDVNQAELKRCRPHINRMRNHMEVGVLYTRTDLMKKLFINPSKVDFCVSYLTNESIIESKYDNGTIKYILKTE